MVFRLVQSAVQSVASIDTTASCRKNRSKTTLCSSLSSQSRMSFFLLLCLVTMVYLDVVPFTGSSIVVGVAASNFSKGPCLIALGPGLEFHPGVRPTYSERGKPYYENRFELRCRLGNRLVGCSEIRCWKYEWVCLDEDDTMPICVPSHGMCPALPEFIRGGSWRLESAYQLDQFAEGDKAILSCNVGFASSDATTNAVSCVFNKESGKVEWSVTKLPTCIPISCPPLIPASLPSGVLVKKSRGDRIFSAPLSGVSALHRKELEFACYKQPLPVIVRSPPPVEPRPEKTQFTDSRVNLDSFRVISNRDGNYSDLVIRAAPDLDIEALDIAYCSANGQWIKGSRYDQLHAQSQREAVPLDGESLLSLLPDCSDVAFNEDRINRDHSDICPPLPFFTNPDIPGWVSTTNQFPSNAQPLHSIARLDCGKQFWPESAATNAEHILAPFATCVQFFQSKRDDDMDHNDDTSIRGKVISRWSFRSSDHSDWTHSAPPTCVPRPTCDALPTYSGWRLASGLPPHKLLAGDKATCTTRAAVVDGTEQILKTRTIACVSDGPGTAKAHVEPALSLADMDCPEVTCPNPGAFPLAFRSAQHHTNFIGHVDTGSLIEDDVRLDYFAVGDVLHYHCYYTEGTFRLKCSPEGQWIMKGEPCKQNY